MPFDFCQHIWVLGMETTDMCTRMPTTCLSSAMVITPIILLRNIAPIYTKKKINIAVLCFSFKILYSTGTYVICKDMEQYSTIYTELHESERKNLTWTLRMLVRSRRSWKESFPNIFMKNSTGKLQPSILGFTVFSGISLGCKSPSSHNQIFSSFLGLFLEGSSQAGGISKSGKSSSSLSSSAPSRSPPASSSPASSYSSYLSWNIPTPGIHRHGT